MCSATLRRLRARWAAHVGGEQQMRPGTPERPAVRENLPVRGLAVVGAATGDLIQRHGRDLPDDAYDFAGGNAHLRPPGADGRAQLGRHDRRRPGSSRGGAAGRPGDPRRRRPSTSRPAGSGLDGVIDCWRTRRPPPKPVTVVHPDSTPGLPAAALPGPAGGPGARAAGPGVVAGGDDGRQPSPPPRTLAPGLHRQRFRRRTKPRAPAHQFPPPGSPQRRGPCRLRCRVAPGSKVEFTEKLRETWP